MIWLKDFESMVIYRYVLEGKMRRWGFTLIEIIIVMSVIGILTTIGTYAVMSTRKKSKISKAKVDIGRIAVAVTQLRADTKLYPGLIPALTTFGLTVPLTNDKDPREQAGLTQKYCDSSKPRFGYQPSVAPGAHDEVNDVDNNGTSAYTTAYCYNNWNGPYATSIPLDPWESQYQMEYDYQGPPYPSSHRVVILSKGADKNKTTCDDIYKSIYVGSAIVGAGCPGFSGQVE